MYNTRVGPPCSCLSDHAASSNCRRAPSRGVGAPRLGAGRATAARQTNSNSRSSFCKGVLLEVFIVPNRARDLGACTLVGRAPLPKASMIRKQGHWEVRHSQLSPQLGSHLTAHLEVSIISVACCTLEESEPMLLRYSACFCIRSSCTWPSTAAAFSEAFARAAEASRGSRGRAAKAQPRACLGTRLCINSCTEPP